MAKKQRGRARNTVIVNLTEKEWVELFDKVPVPRELGWLAGIRMLDPVEFKRPDLGLLAMAVHFAADAAKNRRQQRTLERIADKLSGAMLQPRLRGVRGRDAAAK